MLDQVAFDQLKRLAGAAANYKADENFREMVQDLKNRAIRTWAESQTTERREASWYALQAVGALEAYLDEIGQAYRAEAQKHKIVEEKHGKST